MKEEKYLIIFISLSKLSPNIKKIIMMELKQKYLYKEIEGKMITEIEIIDFNKLPLSRTNTNNIEISVPVKVDYKTYKPGDIIKGDLMTNDKDKRVFVISNDVICEVVNIKDIQSKNNVTVMLTSIKSTSGCANFLAEGNIISF